jgi:hypothetical protein
VFNYRLPGHADYGHDRSPASGGRPLCPACGRIVAAREGIVIAGVPVHLRCALHRRRRFTR